MNDMENLTAQQKALAYIYLYGEHTFDVIYDAVVLFGNTVKGKHLLEVLEEIKIIQNLDNFGDKIK